MLCVTNRSPVRVVILSLVGAVVAGLVVGATLTVLRPAAVSTALDTKASASGTARSFPGATMAPRKTVASRSPSPSRRPEPTPSPAAPTWVPTPWTAPNLELASLKSVRTLGSGAVVITVDRLTFYSGAEAAAYYAKHPKLPPLDYAIVNQSPRIYTYTLVPGAPVFLSAMAGTDPAAKPMASDLTHLVEGFARQRAAGAEVFAWLDHTDADNGWVTYLAEQFFP